MMNNSTKLVKAGDGNVLQMFLKQQQQSSSLSNNNNNNNINNNNDDNNNNDKENYNNNKFTTLKKIRTTEKRTIRTRAQSKKFSILTESNKNKNNQKRSREEELRRWKAEKLRKRRHTSNSSHLNDVNKNKTTHHRRHTSVSQINNSKRRLINKSKSANHISKRTKLNVKVEETDSPTMINFVNKVNGKVIAGNDFRQEQTIMRARKSKQVENDITATQKRMNKLDDEINAFLDNEDEINNQHYDNDDVNHQLKEDNHQLKEDNHQLKEEMNVLQNELEQTKANKMLEREKYESKVIELDKMLVMTKAEVEVLKTKKTILEDSVKEYEEKLNNIETLHHEKCDELNKTIKVLKDSINTLEKEVIDLKEKETILEAEKLNIKNQVNEYEKQITNLQIHEAMYKDRCNTLQEEVDQLKQQHKNNTIHCRELQGKIQDLKGAIRIFCRLKPSDNNNLNFKANSRDCTLQMISKRQDVKGQTKSIKRNFNFDRVFSAKASNEYIFDSELSQLISTVLDGGKNVSIFAYGQTGSGKTYTMFGHEHNKGMIPRSVEQIFREVNELKDFEWSFTLQASMLEIYQEDLYDLLGTTRHKINRKNDVTKIDITKAKEIEDILNDSIANRTVAGTAMNEQSSRSHTVFTLYINGYNQANDVYTQSCLNLVDLAGSERVKKSHASGEQLKEAQNINKSLSALSNVIIALSQKKGQNDHIPFRDSKLTHTLQTSLTGGSKTAFFINIASDEIHENESLCTLRFGDKLKKVSTK